MTVVGTEPVIQLLPEDVASRIAAGEVIERPASVLKELLENALDAGARRISIEARGAGRQLIRISDDGDGMVPADCRAAFERHATSKISRLEDIESLSTFGFRGEALFAIAAVSRTSLRSSTRGSRKGWLVEMRGGKFIKEREAPPAEGTTLEVRDLFFNTPARAKFLKSDASERAQLARVVEEAALANPGVGFFYACEGKTVHDYAAQKDGGAGATPYCAPSGNASERMCGAQAASALRVGEVLGAEMAGGLLPAERELGFLRLRAFLSPTDALKSSRAFQYCFVNRRPVVNRTLQQALYRAYEPMRPKNRHPAAVVFLEVPGDSLDVNVHPTKKEVRFHDESAVFDAVTKTLAQALLAAKGIPALTLRPSLAEGNWTAPGAGSRPVGPQCRTPSGDASASGVPPHSVVADSGPLYAETSGERTPPTLQRPWFSETLRYLDQIERAYLVFEAEGGILVIDQHAAQERILFERYLGELESGKPAAQRLMLPLHLELPASGLEKALAQKARLSRAGFEVEPLGKTSLRVLSVPSVFHKADDIKELIHGLLDSLLSPRGLALDIRYDAAATIACKAAVKAHDPLSSGEALRLVSDLRRCADGTCCPHGRPTMLSLDREELARRFKRPGAPPRH